jgi:hypothetical protein
MFGMIPQVFLCLSHFSFLAISRAFSCDFNGKVLNEFPCGIGSGNHTWGCGASFLNDLSPPNPWKVLQFGGFRWSSRRGGFGGWLSTPLDSMRFRAWAFGQRLPMRYPCYPRSPTWIHEVNQEIDWGEVRVFPAGGFLHDCPGKIGLAGFRNLSDRCDLQWVFERNFGR